MSNSPMVVYTAISPNSNNPRNAAIKKITIHHMAGKLSVETCGRIFSTGGRQASSNYGIGFDGRVGMYCEEKNRSWCSSSPSNDHAAITIEVSNDAIGGNWPVSDKVLAVLIDLCVDICKRNNIPELIYTGDSRGTLTRHNMFAATTCPGPYLQDRFPYITEEVNKRLKVTPPPTPSTEIEEGDIVQVRRGAKTYTGGSIQSWVYDKHYPLDELRGARAVLDKNGLCTPFNVADLILIKSNKPTPPTPPTPTLPDVGPIKKGDVVQFKGGNHYSNANASTPANKTALPAQEAKVTYDPYNGKHPYHIVGNKGVYGWVDAESVSKASQSNTPYLVRVICNELNYRNGPGINYKVNGSIKDKGTYTIIAEAAGEAGNALWGKLKSGAGWIAIDSAYVKKV